MGGRVSACGVACRPARPYYQKAKRKGLAVWLALCPLSDVG